MTIRNRLKVTGLIPIALLVLLSSYFLVTSYQNYEKANALKTVLKNNAVLNDMQIQIGKERGLTALYMGSDRKSFIDPLHKQRAVVDTSVKKLRRDLIIQTKVYLPFLLKDIQLLDAPRPTKKEAASRKFSSRAIRNKLLLRSWITFFRPTILH